MEQKKPNYQNIIFIMLLGGLYSWSIWVTNKIYTLDTHVDTQEHKELTQEMRMKEWVRTNYPPEEMRNDVEEIKDKLHEIELKLDD